MTPPEAELVDELLFELNRHANVFSGVNAATKDVLQRAYIHIKKTRKEAALVREAERELVASEVEAMKEFYSPQQVAATIRNKG